MNEMPAGCRRADRYARLRSWYPTPSTLLYHKIGGELLWHASFPRAHSGSLLFLRAPILAFCRCHRVAYGNQSRLRRLLLRWSASFLCQFHRPSRRHLDIRHLSAQVHHMECSNGISPLPSSAYDNASICYPKRCEGSGPWHPAFPGSGAFPRRGGSLRLSQDDSLLNGA